MDPIKLRLTLVGEWKAVEQMHDAVEHFSTAVFADEMLRDQLTMVSAELLENAVKYSDEPSTAPAAKGQGLINYVLTGNEQGVEVRVSNDAQAGPDDVNALVASIEFIRSASNPAEAYQQRMLEVFAGNVSDGGLGLVRIASEGNCELDCEVLEGGRVEVKASFDYQGEQHV